MMPRDKRIEIRDADMFGRVAVLLGGYSSEREVSLQSGRAVLDALQSRGVDATAWDPAEDDIRTLGDAGIDRVWIALHGPGGEDGALQGALQWLGIPYTGSGVMASAVAMDKIRSKHMFCAAGIDTPDYRVIRTRDDALAAADTFGYPLILKPNREGSSVGMSKVLEASELDEAAGLALGFGGLALAERCIVGQETTVAILQGVALPSIRIETPRVFYDYRAKYESESTRYICPGYEDDAVERQYSELALAAFDELAASGWGRVDFMTGDDGRPQVLEVNTIPGMTSHSLVPMAARKAGIDFAELCWRILETSLVQKTFIGHEEGAANDA
jgi:D-alanine-D-alanine ligase